MPRVTVGTLEFRSKSAAKEYFRAIRDAYRDGEIISDVDAAHLHALVGCHPGAAEKIGCGISHFSVATDNVFGSTRHFVLVRTDGQPTDFSFITCIEGRNERRDRLEALRREVEDQIIAFREASFSRGTVRCPFLGTELSPLECHVDHAPPATFMTLVDMWMAEAGVSFDSLEVTPSQDNQIVCTMTNDAQKRSWDAFHRQNAALRILSPLANLSHAKKERPAKT